MGLFFSVDVLSDVSLKNEGKTTGLSIFISETKPEKSVDSELMLEGHDSAFLVASGRLSFVNLLCPLYYLVCIILTANQL